MDKKLRPVISIRIFRETKCFGPGVAELLRHVREAHSLRGAAMTMGMAYSKAWTIVKQAERELGFPLLVSVTGGRHGGGAELSPKAERLLAAYGDYCARMRAFAAEEFGRAFAEFTEELRTQKGLLELNFCANGRFETRFSLRDHVLLKPGDMAISCYDGVHGSRSESNFPLGYYEGICLEVDPERTRRWVERNAPAFRVDFSALQQNLLGDKWYRCSPAGPRCEHVFRELYESAAYLDPAFLRLKVLELLMLLGSIPRGAGTDAYCSARQAELIRHIRDHLLTDREGYTSLSRLAAEHEMSVSHLQKLFKQIYGVPVYHYIKEYRLEQAAVELVRSARPVTEIAQDAGYDNASKFSACFKERYGVTPSQYRTDAKAKQSIGTKTE